MHHQEFSSKRFQQGAAKHKHRSQGFHLFYSIRVLYYKRFIYVTSVLPACVYVHPVCAWLPERSDEGLDSVELELRMVVSHHMGTGIHSLGPLQKQLVFLATEKSLQPQIKS